MIDKIVVSTDENFRNFIPIACAAWKKFFPSIDVEIAYVTKRNISDPIFEKIKKYGNLTVYEPVEGIPTQNQAKIARHFLASSMGGKICSIEDIDTIPMQREFFEKLFSHRHQGALLAVGAEVFKGTEHDGKFPMSSITAEGYIFKEFINPNDLGFKALIESFIGIKKFDIKEDISAPPDIFSDESLMRHLISEWPERRVQHVNRDVNIKTDWIDRSWWCVDSERMRNSEYVICNFMRPFENHMHAYGEIVDYITPGSTPRDMLLE